MDISLCGVEKVNSRTYITHARRQEKHYIGMKDITEGI